MPNRLADATSPYLLQHAANPVDWYPWGEEAFAKARAEDKPVLLSVGYAACHWCHVMERESFEDPPTARLMNEHFVSIKVDREERPDVDAIYMEAVQAMTGGGGWPMTVFLTPGGTPFYAGTYFPNEDRHGMPALSRVLMALAEAWRDDRERVVAQGERVVAAIARTPDESREPLTEDLLRGAYRSLERSFDPEWGGFGPAPKFPQPMNLELLLRTHLRGYPGALDMATRTLERMASGGMYDQVGGGFARYSTDRMWLVPHFEKMLYDNAQLARLYLHAWQVTGTGWYAAVVRETLDYLLREMRAPEGGLYSAQDADSEGVEGKFYLWPYDELRAVAGEDVARWLGALPDGNREGTNILWRAGGDPSPADWPAARERLYAAREERVRPATDDKVLAGWNGLAIQALAEAGRALGEPRYVEAAGAAAGFVLERMRREDGRLLRAWRDGRTSGPAYAEDHAILAAALLVLHETTFDLRWLAEARALADELVRLFRDRDGGGFFQTGADAEALVVRPKDLFDNAVPSGNSVAAEVLLRLHLLSGEAEYERAAVSALRVARPLMERASGAAGHALQALDLYLSPAREVAVVGEPAAADTHALAAEVWRRFLPNVVLAVARPGDPDAAKVAPLLEGREARDGRATAYVCARFACRRPVTDPAALAEQLAS
ncbi:MAG TPA: thioredoxin domain-containing protein [Actinomycetota bacterium]|nr:thioredoxin domain-containing protein [Actinomycetota bacterium]